MRDMYWYKKLVSVILVMSILFPLFSNALTRVEAIGIDSLELSKECNIFNYIDINSFEDNSFISRLKGEESLDNYVFLNSDGSRTAYFLDKNVKFYDANGIIQEKDITLITGVGGFTTTRNNIMLQIPLNIASGVRLSFSGYDVSVIPQGGSMLTLPRKVDNSVLYDNYFGAGTKLIYTPTLDGVKEDIILTSYRGVNSFSFLLNTDGLNVYQTEENRYYLAEHEYADLRFWLGNVEIFDAATKPGAGTMTVTPVIEGQRYSITISADIEFLTDPSTVYPVTIDPTITVSDNINGAGAILDAPIYEGYPSSNFGTYQYNRAGYGGSAYGKGRTVIKLPGLLSNSTFNSLPATSIGSVLFHIWDATGTAASTVYLYPITGDSNWSENSVTWNSVGSRYNSNSVDRKSANVGSGSKATFDITSSVQKWKLNALKSDNGFMLIGANESSVDRSLFSCEHSTSGYRPYLEVTYYTDAYTSYYNSCGYFNNSPSSNDGLQESANCYGYVMRLYYLNRGYTTYSYYQQPGEFANKSGGYTINCNIGNYSRTETISDYGSLRDLQDDVIYPAPEAARIEWFYQLMKADGARLGFTISKCASSDIYSAPSMTGKRLIALVVSSSNYHFYMQHEDGTWSHKDGHGATTKKCINHGYDLTNANITTHACEGSLAPSATTVAFFYITKTVADTCHGDGCSERDFSYTPLG